MAADYGVVVKNKDGGINLAPDFSNIKVIDKRDIPDITTYSVTNPLFETQEIFFMVRNNVPGAMKVFVLSHMLGCSYVRNGSTVTVKVATRQNRTLLLGVYKK